MPLFLFFSILLATGLLTDNKEGKIYLVKEVKKDVSISGKGDDPLWKNAVVISDFGYPWEAGIPPLTRFKALHNDEWLYCLFDVEDDHVNISVRTNDKSEVASSSRAEIFFKKDNRLSPYYCLEIDPLSRVLDYEANYHRNFDTSWSWPSGELVIKSNRRKDGYSIEVAISKKSLKQLGLLNNNTLQAGLYRGDCLELNETCEQFKWISWVKPESSTPDFHIPSSFGTLKLE